MAARWWAHFTVVRLIAGPAVEQTIYHDGERASHVVLPVIPVLMRIAWERQLL
jgi:hypothetical protein